MTDHTSSLLRSGRRAPGSGEAGIQAAILAAGLEQLGQPAGTDSPEERDFHGRNVTFQMQEKTTCRCLYFC